MLDQICKNLVVFKLNKVLEAEEEYIRAVYPERSGCISMLREKTDQAFKSLGSMHFYTLDSATLFIGEKTRELRTFSRACLANKEDLPSSLSDAIARIDQLVVVNAAASSLNNQVKFWQGEFQKSHLPHAIDCAAPVQGRALEIRQQLEQMKNGTPAELAQLSQGASTHLDYYATRCILDGPSALPELPPGLQSIPRVIQESEYGKEVPRF